MKSKCLWINNESDTLSDYLKKQFTFYFSTQITFIIVEWLWNIVEIYWVTMAVEIGCFFFPTKSSDSLFSCPEIQVLKENQWDP